MKARDAFFTGPAAGRIMAVAVVSVCLSQGVVAQEPRSGEKVYQDVCKLCHADGIDGAPKLGDKAKWGPLIKEGQAVLTAHGWVGVRKMPPKGGRPDLSLEEFSRAVAYMARAAGGVWKDPDAAMMKRIRAEETKREKELKAKKS